MKPLKNTIRGGKKQVAELEGLIERLNVLFSIADAGINSTNLSELLHLIVENIAQGISANRVALITIDQAEKRINHFVRGGLGASHIDLTVSYDELMDGLSGWTIQNKASALSPKNKPDARESAAVQQRRKETKCGSIIVTALQHQGQILGTITAINNPEDRDFRDRDVLIMETAASQAASAIIKASLYEGLERANQLLQEHAMELEREITERKQIELLLRTSENNFRRLFEAAPDAMLIIDQGGKIKLANTQAEKMFGCSKAELLAQPVEMLLPEGVREIHRIHRENYYHDPKARPMGTDLKRELTAQRKDGGTFPVEISLSPLDTETGLSVTAAIRDISTRKQTEMTLRLQGAALEAAANAIVITNKNGLIEWVNPAFTSLTGYSFQEAIGQSMEFLRSGKHSDESYENPVDTLRAGVVLEDEITNRRKDGIEYVEQRTMTPVRNERGVISHFVSIQQDVTARQRMEQMLRQQNNYLTVLQQIMLGLINHHDPDTLLEAVLFHAADLMKTRHAFVDILDLEKNVMIKKVAIGNHVSQLGSHTTRGEGLTGRVWETGEMLIIPNYATWSGRFTELQWQSTVVGLPLKVQGAVIGVIGISFAETGLVFTSEEIDLLERFASLASVALGNAQLISTTLRQSQELSLLDKVRTAITRELDLTSIVNRIVDAVAETFGYTLVSLYLQKGDTLILQHQVGYDRVISTIPITEGVAGRVIRTGEPVLLEDVSSDPTFLGAFEGITSEIAVPIYDEGKPVGVLNIESRHGIKLTQSDLRLMLALGDQISVAIGRARLYSALNKNNERLSLLHQTTLGLLKNRNMDDLLQAIVDQATALFDADGGYLALLDGEFLVDRAFSPKNLPYQKIALKGHEDRSPIWQVFDSREPMITTDFSALSNVRPQTAALGFKAAILLPLLRADTCQGVLGAGRLRPNNPFSEEDIRFGSLFTRVARLTIDNAQLHESLRQESIRDPLTDLFNRRFMQEALARELLKAERNSHPLSVVMLDLDHFKRVNDTFGHDAGDEVLRMLGFLLKTKIRGSDIACRYGGEEFTLILPEASESDALQRMEQLRTDLRILVVQYQEKPINQLTGSFGIAIFPKHGTTGDALLKAADEALYQAKQAGRDRVIISTRNIL